MLPFLQQHKGKYSRGQGTEQILALLINTALPRHLQTAGWPPEAWPTGGSPS
jgi:hypothetical protein